MSKKNSGYRIYFILMIALLICAIILSFLQKNKNYYTKDKLIEDINAGLVKEVVLEPNANNETGAAEVTFNDGSFKELFVTDVTEIEKLLEKQDVPLYIGDIPRQNWF